MLYRLVKPLSLVYRLLLQLIGFAHVGRERQTNIHACMHAYIYTLLGNNFKKPGVLGLKTIAIKCVSLL